MLGLLFHLGENTTASEGMMHCLSLELVLPSELNRVLAENADEGPHAAARG